MNDIDFLKFIYIRMVEAYGENENFDFMKRLKDIIDNGIKIEAKDKCEWKDGKFDSCDDFDPGSIEGHFVNGIYKDVVCLSCNAYIEKPVLLGKKKLTTNK